MLRSAMLVTFLAAVLGRGECAPPPPYDPCEAKSCGDACRACPPDDRGCVETMIVKACDAAGACVAAPVDCSAPYDPCAGKGCGDGCTLCAPNDPDCVETMVLKACDGSGACVTAPAVCPAPYDPCAGKACGEYCSPCAPGEPCPMYFAATACECLSILRD
ncbi:MAG TPA: hypothetical protein VIU40_13480 [Geobacteraceae bacterium]